ncbi:hypothetical protein [Marininema halotolerans]|uniref:Uncharacterized protein n=1 Tax=Marininema halotolerans TaxID=1155944 RepID=A0A1I6PCT4_9BACL|nr:hypothetical protein [Marininema halotolerans]SFS37905.1 hypothetical protein SAMN05444972_101503 [Marininema halotolerans]
MEKWVQMIVAVASLLRLLMELPDVLMRWKKQLGQRKRSGRRKKKNAS